MIHFKAVFQKNILKYVGIIILLFTASLMFFNLDKCVSMNFNEKKLLLENRTLVVKVIQKYKFEDIIIKYKDEIEKSEYNVKLDEYIIIFKNYDSIDTFLNNNNDKFSEIYKNQIAHNGMEVTVSKIFNIVVIISIILIIILILIFSIYIIYNLEKDIALYKLIGYQQSSIIIAVIITIYILYLSSFFISIVITYVLTKFIVVVRLSSIGDINLSFILNLNDYLLFVVIISITILLSFIRMLLKITKITPIELIKSY